MSSGPMMLLKALGIDPEEMQKAFVAIVDNINKLNAQLSTIERRLSAIEDTNLELLRILNDEFVTPSLRNGVDHDGSKPVAICGPANPGTATE